MNIKSIFKYSDTTDLISLFSPQSTYRCNDKNIVLTVYEKIVGFWYPAVSTLAGNARIPSLADFFEQV